MLSVFPRGKLTKKVNDFYLIQSIPKNNPSVLVNFKTPNSGDILEIFGNVDNIHKELVSNQVLSKKSQ